MVAEDELLARAQAGEEEAFTGLVGLYEQRLRAYARAMIHHDQDAEDLTQEALIRIYRALPYFQRQASFATWAFRILARLCLDHLRQGKRRPRCEAWPEPGDEGRLPLSSAPDPEAAALRSEFRARVRAALAGLPDEQRTVVVLHDVCSFKYREIADIARCSIGTVKSRLFTARTRLREMLDPGRPDGRDI